MKIAPARATTFLIRPNRSIGMMGRDRASQLISKQPCAFALVLFPDESTTCSLSVIDGEIRPLGFTSVVRPSMIYNALYTL
ncbi:hypothetical protein N7533_008289 [Penicillium manginii]|jgi:hypothetical protein|uniref:uncharacterized protein n=1 Tax=Penicillium manginii TaxID=203109 RepID=UPI002546F943|nr:uncharacterized protein N7533_008289 [Penicillium manginii]KAJ5751261.1 hypothetical protein N7533_008289 [Penicillium manginii]